MKKIIVWQIQKPPPIYETAFSYRFCLEKSSSLTGYEVLKIPAGLSGQEVYSLLKSRGLSEGPVILVLWPETVLSQEAARLLSQNVERGTIVGPVFNDTPYPRQRAFLNSPYFDVSTFEEMAQELAQDSSILETQELDPACLAVQIQDLAQVEGLLQEIPQNPFLKKRIVTGALVHVFRNSFEAERKDLLKLIPKGVSPILDVGCAKGGLGRLLKEREPKIRIEGIELNPVLAQEARKVYEEVYVGKFEELELPSSYYQLIHMGDVLEHLYDPWETLEKVKKSLIPGGFFTGSVPNISHWSVVKQLLEGDFEYLPLGLLCVSHIRFFTPSSLRRLFEETGFEIDFWEEERPQPTPQGQKFMELLRKIGLYQGEHLLTSEILFRVKRR